MLDIFSLFVYTVCGESPKRTRTPNNRKDTDKMLKSVIKAMLDEMFELGLRIISEAEYWYDFTRVGGDIMPEYWGEYKWGDGLMGTAIELGKKVGYITGDTVWEDEVEYR